MIVRKLTMLEYPIHEEYPATYRDKLGEEKAILHNDGHFFRMTIRQVEFIGSALSDFEPVEQTDPKALELFDLDQGDLCGFELTYDAPVQVVNYDQCADATLQVRLVVGLPAEIGSLAQESLALCLLFKGERYSGRGTSGWFEDELLEIQSALPDGQFIKACISCAYSDYSPYGHSLVGDMTCFRKNKAAYLKVKSKTDMLHLSCPNTETVQETYVCPEFERRTPGTGYRG